MDVTFDFTGKNFVVTGASSGIGFELVRELLEAGANVLGLSRHMTEGLPAFAGLAGNLVGIDADVTDEAALERAIAGFVKDYGPLHGCVHSAGRGRLIPIRVWNANKAREMMELNFFAGMSLLKIASRRKYSAEAASYLYISSVSAERGQMGLGDYSATKGALESMVRCAALETAGRRQRVNSVCLGWLDTPLTRSSGADSKVEEVPLGQGTPADAAGLMLFLLSDRARWITGSNFVMDGGYLA
mgnify:CR=1 FL=1